MSTRAVCLRALVAVTAAVCLSFAGLAESQPVQCSVAGSSNDGPHCDNGLYCDPDVFICRECLRCEDFKREPSKIYSSCVKSVVECGACIKGLVEDHRVGDVNAQCIPRSSRDEEDGFPMYGWVLVALLCLVLMTLFGGIVWCVLKHPDSLMVFASTSMQSRCKRTVSPPSAPDLPPPYKAFYTPMEPMSPSPAPASEYPPSPQFNSEYQPNDEESTPALRKQSPEGAWAARESAGHQAARMFNPPAYVRGATFRGANQDDEETVASTWTPGDSRDQNDNTPDSSPQEVPSSLQLPALLAAARNTSLISQPHTENALQPHVPQDPNNNASCGSGESSSEYAEGESNPNYGHGSSFIINVIQNINTQPLRSDGSH